MESRWYVRPDQTLETTKIEDRGHALHVTKTAWGKLTGHLDRRRLAQEAIDNEEAHRKAIRDASDKMTKSWDNSAENIRIRKEEARLAKLTKESEERMERFHILRAEQAAIKAKYVEEARKKLYVSKGPPITLTSALVGVETTYERGKQIELEKAIKQHDYEEELKYAARVKQAAIDEKLENEEKARKLCEKKKEMGKIYLRKIKRNADLQRIAREETIAAERLDNKNADREMKEIEEARKEEQALRAAEIKKNLVQCSEAANQFKQQKIIDEKEKDIIIDIYGKAKHKIYCLRKKKEREMQIAMQVRRDLAAKKVIADAGNKAETEERLLKAAIEKAEEEELEKLRIKAEYKAELTKDRRKNFEDYFKREERRKAIEAEVRKWEMLNRYKNNEIIVQSEKDKKRRECEARLAYGVMLHQQMAEKDDRFGSEKDEALAELRFQQKQAADEDAQFFQYANEVYDLAVEKGWPTAPLFNPVQAYCKSAGIPMNYKGCPETYTNDKNN